MSQHCRRFRGGCGPPFMITVVLLCLCVADAQGTPQQTQTKQNPPRPWTPNDNNPSYSSGGLCSQPSSAQVAQPVQSNLDLADPIFTCKASSDPNAVNILHSAERNFSVDFLSHMARHNGGGNVFVSPYSVYEALLLSFFTAAGHTEASLRKMLHIPDNMAKIDVLGAHACSQKVLNGQRSEQLRSVNRIYLDKKLKPVNCVKNTLEDEIESISFENPGITDIINAWVAQQTNGKIAKLLLPNSISKDSKLVLTNAVYFKDLWLSQFTPEKTKKEVFYLETHPTQNTFAQMMRQKGSFKIQDSMGMKAKVLELPYKNTMISMLILLPPFAENADTEKGKKSNDLPGVDGVLAEFSAAELTKLLDNDVTPKQVEVAVPKWSASQSIELVQTLEAMGVGDLFQSTANLTDLTGQPGITFDSVVHQAKIDVDEAGTEAAGATAIFSFRSSRPLQPESFICNHPFVYLIVDKTSKTVLFAGIYRSPTS